MSLKQLLIVSTLLCLVFSLYCKYYSLSPGYVFTYDETRGVEQLFFQYDINLPVHTYAELTVQSAVVDQRGNKVYMVMQDQYRGLALLVSFDFDKKEVRQTPMEEVIKTSLFVNLFFDDSDSRLFATVVDKRYPEYPEEWIVDIDKEKLVIGSRLSKVSQHNRFVAGGVYLPDSKHLYLEMRGTGGIRMLTVNLANIKPGTPFQDILIADVETTPAKALLRHKTDQSERIYAMVNQKLFDTVHFGTFSFNKNHSIFEEIMTLSPAGFVFMVDYSPSAIDDKASQLVYVLHDLNKQTFAGTVNIEARKKDWSSVIPGLLGHRIVQVSE